MEPIQKLIEFFLKRKWLGLLLVLGLVAGIGISTFCRSAINPAQRTDLTVYLKASEMINDNRADHIYGIENNRHWHYVYSPFLAILMTPFVGLPLSVNVVLAYLLSVGALFATFILAKFFGAKSQDISWRVALAAILCIPIFMQTLSRAQLGIVMLFFAVLVFYCYLKNWKLVAGFLLGVALSLKISPLGYLIFFFLFKKEWKILTGTFLGGVLCLFIFPSICIGTQQNWELLKIWRGLMSAGSLDQAHKNYLWTELFTPFGEKNQSLYAVVTRLAWPSEERFIVSSNNLIRSLTSAFGFAMLAWLFLKRLPAKPARDQDLAQLLAEYSLYPMLMLFASPVSQMHHFTTLFILFLGALLLMQQQASRSKSYWSLMISIWIAAGSIFLGFTMKPLFGYLGSPLWGSMLLWTVVLFSMKTRD
jgi:hypothetical protein